MPCSQGRKYCYAFSAVADLIGGRSSIKTRYGLLCEEVSGGTAEAFQVAYVNISLEAGGGGAWAQSGWGRERYDGATDIVRYRYAEVNGDNYQVFYDTGHPPADDSVHVYQCDLDSGTGTWSFSFDGVQWQTFQDAAWDDARGASIQWTGEILNLEDHMPGTSANKCSFSSCQRREAGEAYADADIAEARSDDDDRWGAERVSATEIRIWQK